MQKNYQKIIDNKSPAGRQTPVHGYLTAKNSEFFFLKKS
jgi:hypothetical protein